MIFSIWQLRVFVKMGLDCLVIGCARRRHEAEWLSLFPQMKQSESEGFEKVRDRWDEITYPSWKTIDAPVVGTDKAADEYLLENFKFEEGMSREDIIALHKGKSFLGAIQGCDGIPFYSNGTLGYDVDETSFRGEVLRFCEDVVEEELIAYAWSELLAPEESVAYGKRLQRAADTLKARKECDSSAKLWQTDEPTINEKAHILDVAARWYTYWGSKGHAIHGYF